MLIQEAKNAGNIWLSIKKNAGEYYLIIYYPTILIPHSP